jgi:hypothetical protein
MPDNRKYIENNVHRLDEDSLAAVAGFMAAMLVMNSWRSGTREATRRFVRDFIEHLRRWIWAQDAQVANEEGKVAAL